MEQACCFRAPWLSSGCAAWTSGTVSPSVSLALDVVVKLSAILEDHAQRALHPEWAAPAVLEDCGLEESGLMLEPDMCCSFLFVFFRPHMSVRNN